MASSSPRKTLSDPAAVFPQESSDRLLDSYKVTSPVQKPPRLGEFILSPSINYCETARLLQRRSPTGGLISREIVEEFAKTYVPKLGRPRRKPKYNRRQTWG